MLYQHDNFGFSAFGAGIGESWLEALGAVLTHGDITFDEGRKRLSLQSFRIKAAAQDVAHDNLIATYGNKKNIEAVLALTFKDPRMVDIDVNPSFGPGAKSYYTRIKEGRMLEFAAKRLSTIPESKKAVIVFPTYEDYAAVLKNPWNDYLPCIVAVQFRMIPNGGSGRYTLNTIFFARSLDIFQKGLGNLVAMARMSEQVAADIRKATGREISLGTLEGLITDVHLYEETFEDAKKVIAQAQAAQKAPA
jgi:thymidylate synthase